MTAAAFLVFLLITGLPLQFSDQLGLGERHVAVSAILDWYGLEAPVDVRASHGLVSVGDVLFLPGAQGAAVTLPGFLGAVELHDPQLIAAAGRRQVVLLEPSSGAVVDRFHSASRVRRIGVFAQQAALDTDAGVLLADQSLVRWTPADPAPAAITWAATAPVPDAERYRQRFRRRMLTVERFLQDAHSGRLFGTAGIVTVDAAGALLAFLSVSGLVVWWRTAWRS